MKMAVLGFLAGVGVVMVLGVEADQRVAFAQRAGGPTATSAGDAFVAVQTTVGDVYQQVVVIDPRQQAMSVYHVDLKTGRITLKSVRNIRWDLQMLHYNGDNPLPQEIRSLLPS